MAATIYNPPAGAILKPCAVDFDTRKEKSQISLVQYDLNIPILCVSLKKNGAKYSVPEDADVNIRMDKRDGYHVYNPALGLDAERTTAFFAVTHQMSTVFGDFYPIIEISTLDGAAGTAPLWLHFDKNPVPKGAIVSCDEYKTLKQLIEDVKNSISAAAESAAAAAASAKKSEDAAKAASDAAEKAASSSGWVSEKLERIEAVQKDVEERQTDVKERQEDVILRQDDVNASVELARQAALSNGYMQMGIDPDTGHLMYTRTTNLENTIDFAIVDDTNLEVTIHG